MFWNIPCESLRGVSSYLLGRGVIHLPHLLGSYPIHSPRLSHVFWPINEAFMTRVGEGQRKYPYAIELRSDLEAR